MIPTGGFNINYLDFVQISTSTEDNNHTLKIQLYPNPSSDMIYMETEMEIDKVSIYNTLGQECKTCTYLKNNTVNISQLEQGLYFVHLMNRNRTEVLKLIIKR
jgi:hypothetical protein